MLSRGYSEYQKDLNENDKKQIDFPIFGLVNPPKSYNCFLNSIIQSFWMIDSFRHFFLWYCTLVSAQDDKLINELKMFFREIIRTPKNEFDNSNKIYYLKDIRQELAELEGNKDKFPINEMCDATELYDIILTKVHQNLSFAPAGTVSSCGTILQEIIGLNINTRCECPCGKVFNLPQNPDQYTTFISAFKLCDRVKINRKDEEEDILEKTLNFNQTLGAIMKEQLCTSFEFPDVDHYNKCAKAKDAQFFLSTAKEPEVLCIDIRWGEYAPLDVLTCFNLIPNSIKLGDIYDLEGQEDPEYILKGMIIYWGAHYYAFFRVFIDGEEEWLRVDDKMITKKGAWKDIVEESVNAMVTPTIILYEKYKESVLVPKIREMETNFKLDKYFLRKLISETKKEKRKAEYGDSTIKFVHQESSAKDTPQMEVDEEESAVEKRKKLNDQEENKYGDEEEEKDSPPVKDDPPLAQNEPMLAEDEWECEKCRQINKNDKAKCRKCYEKNEVIEMMIEAKRYEERYTKTCRECLNEYNYMAMDTCPKCGSTKIKY